MKIAPTPVFIRYPQHERAFDSAVAYHRTEGRAEWLTVPKSTASERRNARGGLSVAGITEIGGHDER